MRCTGTSHSWVGKCYTGVAKVRMWVLRPGVGRKYCMWILVLGVDLVRRRLGRMGFGWREVVSVAIVSLVCVGLDTRPIVKIPSSPISPPLHGLPPHPRDRIPIYPILLSHAIVFSPYATQQPPLAENGRHISMGITERRYTPYQGASLHLFLQSEKEPKVKQTV